MKIDGTRLKAFWQNPERYRLAYQCNIVTASPSYGLARGSVFHTVLDYKARGESDAVVLDVLMGKAPTYTGSFIGPFPPDALANGVAMAEAYLERPLDCEIIASEFEFDFEIPGSDHRGVGRVDQIIKKDGKLWVLEFKTASIKTRRAQKEEEWLSDEQADFEILGSRDAGYDVEGVLVQYVVEKTPPAVWEPMVATRSASALKRMELKIHQTCETIEMYKATFGLDQPWPHLSNWPCNGDRKWCDHRNICQCDGKVSASDFPGFKNREEHLEILK